MDKVKILFLAANPLSTARLSLDEEIREISEKLRASEYRDRIELVSAWAVRPDDLLQLLNEHKPHVIHFSGHGDTNGELTLVDNNGQSRAVTPKALKALFSTLKNNLQVVVLNACYSRTQAKAITHVVDCAIGMSKTISDSAAIVFAASFYRAIGFGSSIQQAFEQARTALLLEGISEQNTPKLVIREGIDPSQLFLVNASRLRQTEKAPNSSAYEVTTTNVVRNETLNQDNSIMEPIKIIKVISEDISLPSNDGTRGSALYRVPFQLSRRPPYNWGELFMRTWDRPPRFTTMHRPGIASVSGDRIILDGTTIEEVEHYHLETLKLVINRVNELFTEQEEIKKKQLEQQRKNQKDHMDSVQEISDRIKFD